jgi:hypothetical protein
MLGSEGLEFVKTSALVFGFQPGTFFVFLIVLKKLLLPPFRVVVFTICNHCLIWEHFYHPKKNLVSLAVNPHTPTLAPTGECPVSVGFPVAGISYK